MYCRFCLKNCLYGLFHCLCIAVFISQRSAGTTTITFDSTIGRINDLIIIGASSSSSSTQPNSNHQIAITRVRAADHVRRGQQ